MSRTSALVALLMLVALALGTALWWGSSERPGVTAPDIGVEPGPASADRAEEDLAVPEAESPPEAETPDDRVAVADEVSPDHNFSTVDAIWVEGTVVFPPGTPADEWKPRPGSFPDFQTGLPVVASTA